MTAHDNGTGPLTLKPQQDLTPLEERGDYIYGDNQAVFLRTDWSWDQVMAFTRASNEPFQGLFLSALGADTWRVLHTLLGSQAAKELAAMRAHSEYEDCYTGRHSLSLVPLVVLTRSLAAYAQNDSFDLQRLEFSSEAEHNLERELQDLNQPDYVCRVRLDRITQVLMGTGYTRSCLPSDGDSIVAWQFAELTNGDILLLAGYEWFNQ